MPMPLHSENIRLKQDVTTVLHRHHAKFSPGAGAYAGGYEAFVLPDSTRPTVKVYYAGSADREEQETHVLAYRQLLKAAGLDVWLFNEGGTHEGRLVLIVRRKVQ